VNSGRFVDRSTIRSWTIFEKRKSTMTQNQIDLASLFQAVTQSLAENQAALDQADSYNHNHGANMVQTFETITNALQEKQGKSNRTALNYAAKQVVKSSTSSSGQLYGQGLARAARQVKGKKMETQDALQLLQTLIGGGEPGQQGPQAAGGDLLGMLLGAGQAGQQGSQQAAGGDLLGSLLGGMAGGASSGSGSSDGLDLGDLLNAGMSFLQAKQSGGSTAEALIQAFVAGSGMGRSPHRDQSTTLVVDSFLKAMSKS
jgi:hypothetical protein